MAGLDRDDILRAAGRREAAEGSAKPGVGTVLHAGGDARQRAMVDEHERLHMELNGCTSFGMLLSLVGQGRLDLPELERRELLATLVELCRKPHEVYATTLSVSYPVDDDGDRALADYPGYEEFLALGRALMGGYPPGSMIAQALLVAACIVAMQVPLDLLSGGREDWFTEPLDVAPAHCPSCRFDVVLEVAESGLLDFAWIGREVDPIWLVSRSPDPYGSPEHKRAYHLALIRTYHQYAWELGRRDIPVLPWDEHLRYRTTPIHSPAGPGRFQRQHLTQAEAQALEAATAHASNVHHVIRSSERQSLRRATFQEMAAVKPLADILSRPEPALGAHTFARQGPADLGLHLIVRPVEAVVSSYSMPDEHVAIARAAAIGGVLTALRVAGDLGGDWLTLLAVMTSRDDLERLVRACIADRGVPPVLVSSISRSCLFSRDWRNEWLTPLRYVTNPMLLEDLPPSVFLATECDPDGLNFAVLRFEDPGARVEGFDPVRGVVIERNRAAGTVERFLAFMGSGVLIDNLALRIADLPRAKPDTALARSPAALAMRHLATEEPQFDFNGHEHIAPAGLTEPEDELTEFDRWSGLSQQLLAHQRRWKRQDSEG